MKSLISVFKEHHLITGRIATWAQMLSIFHLIYAAGLYFDPERFQSSEVYDVIQSVTSPNFWALGFLTPAILFFLAAQTRKFVLWAIGMFFSILVSLIWFFCLILGRLDGAPLTSGGIALWVWFLFTNLMVATVPNQVEPMPGGSSR